MDIASSCVLWSPPLPLPTALSCLPALVTLGDGTDYRARLRLDFGLDASSTCIPSCQGLQKAQKASQSLVWGRACKRRLETSLATGSRGDSERSFSDRSGITPTQFELRLVQTPGPSQLTCVSLTWLVDLEKRTFQNPYYPRPLRTL